MNKTEYLARTLSRTKRKDYENYVVNRIYHLLNDLEIKPVTQQYVKRPNDKYALLDLYFPQLEVAIECDEYYHNKQEKDENGLTADELRAEDVISAIGYKNKPERIRIFNNDGTYRDIKEINDDIDKVVKLLRERKKEKKSEGDFRPWLDKSDLEIAKELTRNRKPITVYDDFSFRTTGEVKDFFGLGVSPVWSGLYPINDADKNKLWFPHLAIENNGVVKSGTNSGHINLYVDPETILECVNYDEQVSLEKIMAEDKSLENFKRVTFAKSRNNLGEDGYRFLGVFEKTGEVIEKKVNSESLNFRVFKRIKEEINGNNVE